MQGEACITRLWMKKRGIWSTAGVHREGVHDGVGVRGEGKPWWCVWMGKRGRVWGAGCPYALDASVPIFPLSPPCILHIGTSNVRTCLHHMYTHTTQHTPYIRTCIHHMCTHVYITCTHTRPYIHHMFTHIHTTTYP